jgi:cytochrome b6-f complex iron-sulfur subunit
MSENEDKSKLSRRYFFGLVWVIAGVALVAQAGKALMDFLTPVLEEGAFGTVVYAGKVNEFEVGSVNYFREARFYLVRLEAGFLALYRKCPHLGCVVPWVEVEGDFNCPCHSSLFNVVGEVLSGPAPRPMDVFPVEVRGDEVYVDTGQVIERGSFDPSQVTPA